MKVSNMALIFVSIALCILLPISLSIRNYEVVASKKIAYNQIVDDAVDDAIDKMVESDHGDNIVLNKDSAVENFFQSLYCGFGITDNKEKQEYLKLFIPVILVTDRDGYYLYQKTIIKAQDGSDYMSCDWTEKRKYSYFDKENNLIINFTLTDYITIYDANTSDVLEGNYHDIAKYYSGISFLQEDEEYQKVRKTCIIEHLTKDMQDAITNHNQIASEFGITYAFVLPTMEDADWYRTIDDISFLALFQGYPIGGSLGTYNRYALGGARIRKANMYYIKEENGTKYYHSADCDCLTTEDRANVYYSKRECASLGAYPATDCNP